MNQHQQIIPFVAEPIVDSDDFATSYWMKLEQVGLESDAASISDVAELLDELYDSAPCIDSKEDKKEEDVTSSADTTTEEEKEVVSEPSHSTTTGGLAPDTDEEGTVVPPFDETEFLSMANKILDFNSCENDGSCFTAQLRVYRSHPAEDYKLILENGTITKTLVDTAEVNDTAAIDNASGYNLPYPLSGDLECGWISFLYSDGSSPDTMPEISVDGSTLSWGRNGTGILDIRYTTQFDLVYISIPNTEDGEMGSCNVFALYHGDIYEITLQPPTEDPTLDELEKQKFCLKSSTGVLPNDHKQTCYKDVHHIVYCECSIKEGSLSWDSEDTVPCPESFRNDSGRFVLGSENVVAGTADCGETTAVNDPEMYERVCCHPPKFALPKCVVKQTIFNGGVGINVSREEIFAEYGPLTKIEAIPPKNGPCGYHYVRQVVEGDCCDGVPPLTEKAGNPHTISPGGYIILEVEGGRSDTLLTWEATGGLKFQNGWTTMKSLKEEGIYAPSSLLCKDCWIKVKDGCTAVMIHIVNTAAIPLEIPDDDYTVAPGEDILIAAIGGVLPYNWGADTGLQLISHAGAYAQFRASPSFCGQAIVTVSDGCTELAQAVVSSTAGEWVPVWVPETIHCAAPISGDLDATDWLVADGYRVFVQYGITNYPLIQYARCAPGNFIASGSHLLDPQGICFVTLAPYFDVIWPGYTKIYADGKCGIINGGVNQWVYYLWHEARDLQKWECSA